MLLLGHVRELEVERERTEDARLPLERQARDRSSEIVVRRATARCSRERTDALDVGEERLVLLLDEHLSEQVAEQANVAAERSIGWGLADGHPRKRRTKSPENRTIICPGREATLASKQWVSP